MRLCVRFQDQPSGSVSENANDLTIWKLPPDSACRGGAKPFSPSVPRPSFHMEVQLASDGHVGQGDTEFGPIAAVIIDGILNRHSTCIACAND
jgi:hypothetical protein